MCKQSNFLANGADLIDRREITVEILFCLMSPLEKFNFFFKFQHINYDLVLEFKWKKPGDTPSATLKHLCMQCSLTDFDLKIEISTNVY